MWTNEGRIRRGFWLEVVLAIVIGLASLLAVHAVVRDLSNVAFHDATDLVEVQKLQASIEAKGRRAKNFLLTGDAKSLDRMRDEKARIATGLASLRTWMNGPDEREILDEIENDDRDYQSALEQVIALRGNGTDAATIVGLVETRVHPARDEMERSIRALTALEERQLSKASRDAKATVAFSLKLLLGLVAAALLVSGALSVQLRRALGALRAQREEVLRHAQRVQELNHELDAFAGRASHELRNLLCPIGFTAALLRRSGHEPTSSRERVDVLAEKIQRGIDRSVAMLDGLLVFSRAGRAEPSASSSVADVVNQTMEELAPIASRIDAVIEHEIEDAEVACSAELLHVVVLNLLGNALKFLEREPRRVVRVEAHPLADEMELVVSDSGPGIPEHSLSRIFEPFYRVGTKSVRGTGIGLATVRRIVDAHRGRVSARSTPGQGASVHVLLPLARRPVCSPHLLERRATSNA